MNLLFIIIGLVLLVAGGDWLLRSAVGLSLRLNIPRMVIGMTVVSFATSAPELIVSVKSALDGFPDIALGNVVGSNIANLGLVLGITVTLSAITVKRGFYKVDWPIMMLASAVLYAFIVPDGILQRWEGGVLFAMLVLFILFMFRNKKEEEEPDELAEIAEKMPGYGRIFIFLLIGGVALWGGSELLIRGAVGMAKHYGVSERVIAVTVVSVGTSIPELAASIMAVIRKEKAISLGNLIGSNIFNILAVLGITAMITPIQAKDERLINSDLYWMLGIALLILPLVLMPKKMQLGRVAGILLLVSYTVFVYLTL
ncbi:calcium/sodium antiporter [Sinomicrobium weinanense]|uniref:Calcium/sodium antiporter n=1 Tax=Sinomicrobium weinanense TaxID=2842200 RepID=A0A926Q0S2_9FLAO|nr:calcium/sodium antiporter [Sinomicrobium weinanense]MBC9795187.1 calcium/sodium antiporter [Sinomicrobium weinanense]MBU3121964.1 calcium/sodium antiporter [Sinomicrobium weinanense]